MGKTFTTLSFATTATRSVQDNINIMTPVGDYIRGAPQVVFSYHLHTYIYLGNLFQSVCLSLFIG